MLSAFGTVLPEEERRALNQRLGSLGRLYSRPREWDVFLADTVQPLAQALPNEPSIIEIDAAAREARKRALPDSGNLRRQVDDVVATIEEAEWLQRPGSAFEIDWQKDLKGFASDLLAKRHRRLRKHLKKVDISDRHDFHQLRIEAKKIRYPTEMFGNLFEPKAADAYLDRLVAVQDALGHLNDAMVAGERVAELPLSSRAQGLVSGWLAHELAARREPFPALPSGCARPCPSGQNRPNTPRPPTLRFRECGAALFSEILVCQCHKSREKGVMPLEEGFRPWIHPRRAVRVRYHRQHRTASISDSSAGRSAIGDG